MHSKQAAVQCSVLYGMGRFGVSSRTHVCTDFNCTLLMVPVSQRFSLLVFSMDITYCIVWILRVVVCVQVVPGTRCDTHSAIKCRCAGTAAEAQARGTAASLSPVTLSVWE